MTKQLDLLTDEEKEYLTKYTSNLAFMLNFAFNNKCEDKYSNIISILDSALSKETIPDNLILRRKVDIKVVLKKEN